MPVCPIDAGRYGSDEMRRIFDESNKLGKMLEVEAALAKALAKIGEIPKEAAEVIVRNARIDVVTVEEVKEREKRTKHDVMAMVEVLAEKCGKYGEFVHWGATSYDIVDTAWALILREALKLIETRLIEFMEELKAKAKLYSATVMPGRTHGQHAIPITLGFKMAVYLSEVMRHYERLQELKRRLLVGKISGAVGTMASLGDKALEIEREFSKALGLEMAEISTQVVCRDRIAELILWAALVGSSLDRIATEIRNLQRTEIMEVAEGFEEKEQVGSSTMPHKQNPVTCEKVSGLAKVLRGLVVPALENIPLWHERDLTNSSSERFEIPLTLIILEEMLRSITSVLRGLRVFPENMSRNLEITRGLIMTEAVMMALARKGMGRQRAHRVLRELSIRALSEGKPLKEALLESEDVLKYLSPEEIGVLVNPENYLGKCRELINRVMRSYELKISKRP